jgi:O-antigen/teichoic acid export membrane protein
VREEANAGEVRTVETQRPADPFQSRHLHSELKRRSVRGGAITFSSQGCTFALQTASTVVLARLLTPADFGLIAMVTAVIGFLRLFSHLGLSMATVQKAEITRDQVSTLFWINTAFGAMVALLVVSCAPLVAWFYGDPRLAPVTMVLGSAFILGGMTVQHAAMLNRNMRFLAIGVVEVISTATGIAAAIIAGLAGAGYWSLVFLPLVTAATSMLGTWIAFPWIPGRPKRGVGTRSMLRFGGNITAFNTVNYFARNADNILIGKFLGSTALGFYSKAYGLLMLPISQVRAPLFRVAIPTLSRLQSDPERYRSYYVKMLQILAFITFPMVMFLGGFADEIILLVLGPQWTPAAPIFTILAFAAFLQPVDSTSGIVMTTRGLTTRYFRLGSTVAVVLVASFVIGLPWGVTGVALSYTIANYLLHVPCLYWAFHGTPIRMRDFFGALLVPLCAAVILLVASKAAFSLATELPLIPALLLASLAGAAAYGLAFFCLPGGRQLLKSFRTTAKMLLPSS